MFWRYSTLALALSLSAWSGSLLARTFCCEANGKTYCDEGLPAACYGKAYRELNMQGVTVRHYAAPLTPEQQARKDAELAKQREAENLRLENEKRDRKLVGSYATLMDLEVAQQRTLTDLGKGQQQLEQKLLETEKRKKQLESEAEFYKTKPMPPVLKTQMTDNTNDIQVQKKNIADRAEEIAAVRKRMGEEKARYEALTGASGGMPR